MKYLLINCPPVGHFIVQADPNDYEGEMEMILTSMKYVQFYVRLKAGIDTPCFYCGIHTAATAKSCGLPII